jgi:hypothetical protein
MEKFIIGISIPKDTYKQKISGTNYVCIKIKSTDSWQAYPPRLMENNCKIVGCFSKLTNVDCISLVERIPCEILSFPVYKDYCNDGTCRNENGTKSIVVGYEDAKESLKSYLVKNNMWSEDEEILIIIHS